MKGGADAFTVNEQVLASQPVRRRSPVRPRASLLTSARDSNMSSSEPPSVSGPRADDTAPTPNPRMDLAQDGMVYEAKVIDTRAEGAPEYKVHYQGWNKKWDEWLAPSKIVRDTPENRTAMEAANEAARAAASGAAPSGKSGGAGKSKEPPASDAAAPKPKKAKTEKPADKDKVKDKDKDGKPSKPAAGKAKSAKAPKAEKSEAVPAAPAPAPPAEEVRLDVNLSVALKRELIAGWERITRENKLVALPRDVTVADVLARFVADAKTRARNPEQAALAEEIADGLRAYFDGALKPALLYREERGQAETVLASRGGTAKAPSEVYGAEHLLRLFVKLPELLPLGDMDAAAGRALQVKLTEFLRWLQRNAASSFGGAYVERDAQERGNGGKGEKVTGENQKASDRAPAPAPLAV